MQKEGKKGRKRNGKKRKKRRRRKKRKRKRKILNEMKVTQFHATQGRNTHTTRNTTHTAASSPSSHAVRGWLAVGGVCFMGVVGEGFYDKGRTFWVKSEFSNGFSKHFSCCGVFFSLSVSGSAFILFIFLCFLLGIKYFL
ncbi:hypothetical protein E2C01_051703 [Portunus trituberculatus]|uniref:Uncharacterized protein n=1 Tax=Portunus trituberculatus TaxID=210409 RepID=A0A5B7GJG4_PORTR|nr:hypothetical protein [Portunus trituberculatus]